ncbi:hypothetical protein [Clostridium aminobutyricum]|uniref:Uncharacterized protein n=1 Tax=Clostridium aminobutyricum TaxID=33953 RepID=A0A939D9Z6_CLOAM|nr:hypothetical protein [Clostridium aminobutyricum]MBN7773840.1 hypothetical protein [Clostridium aminobutyricum]
MAFTKCKLGIGFTAETKVTIDTEAFCFNPTTTIKDDLGMIKYGRLIVPATGWYRLTALGDFDGYDSKESVDFGFDLMNDSNTGSVGRFDDFAMISINGNSSGHARAILLDAVYLTEGQILGCIYLKGTSNQMPTKVYRPTLTIERLE